MHLLSLVWSVIVHLSRNLPVEPNDTFTLSASPLTTIAEYKGRAHLQDYTKSHSRPQRESEYLYKPLRTSGYIM